MKQKATKFFLKKKNHKKPKAATLHINQEGMAGVKNKNFWCDKKARHERNEPNAASNKSLAIHKRVPSTKFAKHF